ncbi:MAG: S1C family serine protease [Geothrix sp.]|nr:S1C family serine protease [Geothrix sp.]
MRFRHLLAIPLFCAALWGQDAALKDTFLQAKALWATQGDREGASARFDGVVAALAPKAGGLEPEWIQILCESYNWLAVLDDRGVQTKPRAQVRLQALMDLNPDFEVDRALTSQRLAALFDRMKGEKYALVKLSYAPVGGRLLVDGRPGAPLPRKYLAFGIHKLTYTRPGHAPAEIALELGPRDVKSADFKLARTASTLTLYVQPGDVEILLDGQSLGYAIGKAGSDAAPLALPLGLRPEELSAAFVIPELAPGKHRLELRAPCFRTRTIELGAELATPAADHTLEPIRMEPSRGTLSVNSAWPGGELFLSGQSRGPLPVADLPVCSGSYDLLVRFPAGGFAQRITVEEGQSLALEARPKPRLAFAGLEGGDFTGRARFLAQLEALGDRLQPLAYLPARPDEPPAEALARLKASREAELVLIARPVPDKIIHRVELVLATLDGEEARLVVKPLEQDPLGSLAARLNAVPRLQRPGLGLSVLDVPSEPGPWVLAASAPALKAGIQIGKPLLQVQGKPVPTAQGLQRLVEAAQGPVSVSQEGATASLPLQMEALEIPLGSPDFCYPAVLAQLRLQYAGAKGDEANLIKLNQALVLMQFRKYDKAIELLRDARLSTLHGVSQGTLDYHTGLCFLHLGTSYHSEAGQAFRQALKYPQSTLLGPDGPLVAPLARQALEDLK